MSGSNRGAGGSALAEEGDNAQTGEQGSSGGDSSSNEQAENISAVVEQPASPDEAAKVQQQTQTEQPAPHILRDLVAQETMAEASFWMAAAALGTMLVTMVGTLLIWRQVSLTREAVEDTSEATEAMRVANTLAEKLGEAQARCYIFAASCRIGFTPDGSVVIMCAVRNSGQTPARSVSASLRLTVFNGKDLWEYSEVAPSAKMASEIDIAAREEQEITVCLVADLAEIRPLTDEERFKYSFTVEGEILAVDVFGRAVHEPCRLGGLLTKELALNQWAEGKPLSRMPE